MRGGYRTSRMQIADGAVPHVAKGGTTEITWYGDTCIGIACCNGISN